MLDKAASQIIKLYSEQITNIPLNINHSTTKPSDIPTGTVPPTDYPEQAEDQAQSIDKKEDRAAVPPKKIAGILQKINREDLDKSEVLVVGYGVVTLGDLKKNVIEKLKDLANRVEKNEPIFVHRRMTERYGFLPYAVKALVDIEKQIEKMRRAGKMPGMLKRYNYSS